MPTSRELRQRLAFSIGHSPANGLCDMLDKLEKALDALTKTPAMPTPAGTQEVALKLHDSLLRDRVAYLERTLLSTTRSQHPEPGPAKFPPGPPDPAFRPTVKAECTAEQLPKFVSGTGGPVKENAPEETVEKAKPEPAIDPVVAAAEPALMPGKPVPFSTKTPSGTRKKPRSNKP